MMFRWPSWAPRSEFLFYDKVQHFAKLVPHFGFQAVFRLLFGNVYVPVIENAALKKPSDSSSSESSSSSSPNHNNKWPIVVFSHGIGCSRFMYSQICYDIASYGFIVAATEHR